MQFISSNIMGYQNYHCESLNFDSFGKCYKFIRGKERMERERGIEKTVRKRRLYGGKSNSKVCLFGCCFVVLHSNLVF